MESPDIHTPHVRRGGLPRWLELLIALTAVITSVSSIVIAVHNGRVMERLVQSNSLPFMQGGFSTSTLEGADVISLDLLDRGVGPAHEVSLRVRVGDRNVRSLDELISASLGADQAAQALKVLHEVRNRVRTRFIPGGQAQSVFRIAKTAENARFWDALAQQQARWDLDFCYCSVFQECWRVPGKWQEPEHVKQCRRDEAREFLP